MNFERLKGLSEFRAYFLGKFIDQERVFIKLCLLFKFEYFVFQMVNT
jgi:hypothetical protein